jgi:hypothetical protein
MNDTAIIALINAALDERERKWRESLPKAPERQVLDVNLRITQPRPPLGETLALISGVTCIFIIAVKLLDNMDLGAGVEVTPV